MEKITPKKSHSVPVPRFYKEASKVLKRYCDKEGSLKTLLYKQNSRYCKRILPILTKITSNYKEIQRALDEVKLFEEQPGFDPYLAMVLASEMVSTGKCLSGDCKPIITINQYGKRLRKRLEETMGDTRKSCQEKEDPLPRYVRINTLIMPSEEVHDYLYEQGWQLQEYDHLKVSYDEFLSYIQELGEYCYLIDYHIPDLLVFPPKQEFWNNELYKNNAIVLQDKASCLPPFISSVKPGCFVIDACAAPGNKTTHLANLMFNEGCLVAVDKDSKRFQTLENFLHYRGVSCAKTINRDFTSLDPAHYPDVEVILVDPSCSSSGTSAHPDKVSKERKLRLAAFQFQVLSHALSFGSVKSVIYSTCSVHKKENEAVVEKALSVYGSSFSLENLGEHLPGWKHFGSKKYDCGQYCLRTKRSIDLCQGFFVAKFVRKSEENSVV